MRNAARHTGSTNNESDLIVAHDPRIRGLAARFVGNDVDDLAQVGRLAFLEAARAWQTKPHVAQLWTYARRAVLGAMIDYVTKDVLLRVDGDDAAADEVVDSAVSPDERAEVGV
jgi:DNA-directed RNA polymerase specialized sigma subunit